MPNDASEHASLQRAPRAIVRPLCRGYAAVVVVVQVFLLAAIYRAGTANNFFPYGVAGLTLIGALLLAGNQPVGRSVFIPAAILQVVVMGFASLFGLMGLLASWFQQSGAGMRSAATLTMISGSGALLLLAGLPLVVTGVRRD